MNALPQIMETKHHKLWKQNTTNYGNKMPQIMEIVHSMNLKDNFFTKNIDSPETIIWVFTL